MFPSFSNDSILCPIEDVVLKSLSSSGKILDEMVHPGLPLVYGHFGLLILGANLSQITVSQK
jgi:hypothetical protein